MPKFRSKVVEIEAEQFHSNEPWPRGVMPAVMQHNRVGDRDYWPKGAPVVITIHLQVTLVADCDWIITEPDGEHFYPCKPDIFAKKYKPVEEGAAGNDEETPVGEGRTFRNPGTVLREPEMTAEMRQEVDLACDALDAASPLLTSERRAWRRQILQRLVQRAQAEEAERVWKLAISTAEGAPYEEDYIVGAIHDALRAAQARDKERGR